MKAKVIIILSTVAVLHLVLGGMFLTGGCAPEDPPMPPGIYVPQPAAKAAPQTEPSADIAGPSDGTDEFKLQIDKKDSEPLPPPELSAPAPEKTAPAVKPQETKKSASALTDKDTTYVVQKGDSLWKIARMYGISVAELAAYNNIAPSKPIRIGQKLMIPAGSREVKIQKTTSGTAAKKSAKKTAAKKSGKKTVKKTQKAAIPADGVYIVKEGDSFSKIAAKYGVTVSAIAAANPGVSSNRLQIGQKLNLPSGSKASAAGSPEPAVRAASPAPVETKQSGTLDEELLLKDIQNPDAAPLNIPAAEAAPAAETAPAPAPAAPAQDKPLASDDAVKAVTDANAPASSVTAPATSPDKVVPTADTTISALAAQYGVKADDVKALNPQLPADGSIKAGTVVQLP